MSRAPPGALTLGYEPFHPPDERAYTPFQSQSHRLIAKGEIHKANVDPDLFGYACNKSNIDASQFDFRQHDWRAHTRIERSNYTDLRLEQMISDAAEESAARMNRGFGSNYKAIGHGGCPARAATNSACAARTWLVDGFAPAPARAGCRMPEVGSWLGNGSTQVFLNELAPFSGAELFCVDTWRGNANVQRHLDIVEQYDVYSTFLNNVAQSAKPTK